jgi:hypothetical protein
VCVEVRDPSEGGPGYIRGGSGPNGVGLNPLL